VEPARGRLAVGPLAEGRAGAAVDALGRLPARYDLTLPGNQRKLEAADALARLADGHGPLADPLAIAFVLRHPGDHERDHRPAHDGAARLATRRRERRARRRVLDRIDAIVPPGHQPESG
jgi:hypothetical protein